MVRFTLLAAICCATLSISSAVDAQSIDPDVIRQTERDLRAVITPREVDLRRPVIGANHDGATNWVSPLLRNHPGTISGNRYSVDGDRFLYEFGFTIINPDLDSNASVGVDCYSADGERDQKYSRRFEIEPLAADQWRSDSAPPTPSTDSITIDEDYVWCHIWADRPVFAFGVRYTEVGSDRNAAGFNLIASAR